MNYDLLLKSIIDLAERAGKDIINIYNNSTNYNITYKSDSSPLTAADKASNKTICDGLEKITPEIPIISEEGKNISYSKRKTWKTFWLIDPLDGTKEFINKNGEFSVNIALIDNNVPIMGVVHAPVIQTTWYGSVYHKSYKINNNKTFNIKVNSPRKEESIKVVSSRSHSNNPKLEKYLKQFKNYSLIKMGSSIKICLVADGTAHVSPFQLGNSRVYTPLFLAIDTSPYLLLKSTLSSLYLEIIAAPAPKLPWPHRLISPSIENQRM